MHIKRKEKQAPGLERKSSFLSDATFESISESETSTAPSSLQTIVRAPYVTSNSAQYSGISEYYSSSESSSSLLESKEVKDNMVPNFDMFETSSQATTDSELVFSSASKLRKVSEQLLNVSRSRTSVSGTNNIIAPLTGSTVASSNSSDSRPGSIAAAPLPAAGSPRVQKGNGIGLLANLMGTNQAGPASIAQSSSSGSSDSRPASRSSIPVSRPSSCQLGPMLKQSSKLPVSNSDVGNISYISPANTVGLPQINNNYHNNTSSKQQLNQSSSKSFNSPTNSIADSSSSSASVFASKIPRLNMFSSPTGSENYPETGGLLSTISQAALSDDESPPATHVPSQPKFNTASLARNSNNQTKIQNFQPNYENLESAKQLPYPTISGQDKQKSGMARRADTGVLSSVVSKSNVSGGMTQGQYRAAASQVTQFYFASQMCIFLQICS